MLSDAPLFAVEALAPTTALGARCAFDGPRVTAVFATREEAEADCLVRERAARRQANPFHVRQGCLASLTSLEPALLHDWVLDAGFDPPVPDDGGAVDWEHWYRAGYRMRRHHRELLWERLDRVRFYRVREHAPPPPLHVLLENGWSDNHGEHHRSAPCRAVAAYAAREPALRAWEEHERLRQQAHAERGFGHDSDPADPYEQGLCYRLAELPSEEGPDGAPVFLLLHHLVESYQRWSDHPPGLRLFAPLRTFRSRGQSAASLRGLEGEARLWLNPFSGQFSQEEALALQSGLRGLNIEPPDWVPPARGPYRRIDWDGWWRRAIVGLSPGQVHAVWGLFDQSEPLYEVVELPLLG